MSDKLNQFEKSKLFEEKIQLLNFVATSDRQRAMNVLICI